MANPYLDAGGSRKNPYLSGGTGARNPYLTAGGGGGTESEIAALEEQLATSGGAEPLTGFVDAAKGLGGTAIDLLSRPNYAVAGAVEEIAKTAGSPMDPGALARGTIRALKELGSGLPGVKGEKRAFGEVMEGAGVGELGSLSDIASPLFSESGKGLALQRGGPLDITGRGALGFALDIAADPLTYLGGAGLGRRVATEAGSMKLLSEAGESLFRASRGKVLAETAEGGIKLTQADRYVAKRALEAARDADVAAGRLRTTAQIGKAVASGEDKAALAAGREAAEDLATAKVEQAIRAGRTDLIREDGIYWAGIRLGPNPLRSFLGSGLSVDNSRELARLGAHPATFAEASGIRKAVDAVAKFVVPGGSAARLPGYARLVKDYHNGVTVVLHDSEATIRDAMEQGGLAWKGMDRGAVPPDAIRARLKAINRAIDEQTIHALPPGDRDVAVWIARRFDAAGQADVRAGTLSAASYLARKGRYVAHHYENDPAELARALAKRTGQPAPPEFVDLGRYAEERSFDTLAEAERLTKDWNAADPTVPVLRPLDNPFENLRRREARSIKTRGYRNLVGSVETNLGPPAWNPRDLYEFADRSVLNVSPSQTAIVERILAADRKVDKVRAVAGLSDPGKRLFMQERIARSANRQELMAVLEKYKPFSQFMPKQTGIIGEVAPDGTLYKHFSLPSAKLDAIVPESAAQDLTEMGERLFKEKELKILMRGYDMVNNAFKGAVTVLFPAFHFRNAYSNVAQGFLDIGISALHPGYHSDAVKVLLGAPGEMVSRLNRRYSYDEIRGMLDALQVKVSPRNLLEMDPSRAKGQVGRYIESITGTIGKYPREVAGGIENEARAMMFITYLRRGLDPTEAAERVNKFLFDYTQAGMTRFERDGMRRIIPFYTWMSKNLKLQVDSLFSRPGRLATEIKPFRGRESENQSLTYWDAGALKVRLNRDGQTLSVITGVDLPVRQLDLIWRGRAKDTLMGALGMLSPALKGPVEVATGTSLFTGRQLGRQEANVIGRAVEHMPPGVRSWLGYVKRTDAAGREHHTFDGERFYILAQSFVLSRFVSTTERQWREYLNRGDWGAALLDIGTGLRWKDFNLTDEQERRAKDRLRQLREAAIRRGLIREGAYYQPTGATP